MDGGQEVDRQLVEPCPDGPALLEPPDALLDTGPLAVQGRVEPVPTVTGLLVPAVRDDGLDAVAAEPPADVRVAVPLVPGHRLRPAAGAAPAGGDADRIHDPLELGAFLPLTAGQDDGQRQPVGVGDEVKLGPETAPGAAQGVVSRLTGGQVFPPRPPAAARDARTFDPSTQYRE